MMAKTKIEWTSTIVDGKSFEGYTFNPWIGCTKVSPGCKYCYAERENNRRKWSDGWGKGVPRHKTSDAYWEKPRSWNEKAKKLGVNLKVFCASLSDVFDEDAEASQFDRLLRLIHETSHLNWLILTKRPQNIDMFINSSTGMSANEWLSYHPNVWLGVSVENQKYAEERIPVLLKYNATVRFLSCEPLLGFVDLTNMKWDFASNADVLRGVYGIEKPWTRKLPNKIDWVIVGGESGAHQRTMDERWAISLRMQTHKYGTPFFMKQMGGHPDKRSGVNYFPKLLRVREIPVPGGEKENMIEKT